MKRVSILLLPLLLLASTCLADPPQATVDVLKVPDAVDVAVVEKRLAKEDFPAGLLAAMSQFAWGGNKEPIRGELDTRIPDHVDFQIVDLNADASPEYFANTYLGGTGGVQYLLFAKAGDRWQCIGESSNFKLLPKKNGWHPIVSFGRSGQYYNKIFYEFSDGRYRHVETHEILDGKVTIRKSEQGDAGRPAARSKPRPEIQEKGRSNPEVLRTLQGETDLALEWRNLVYKARDETGVAFPKSHTGIFDGVHTMNPTVKWRKDGDAARAVFMASFKLFRQWANETHAETSTSQGSDGEMMLRIRASNGDYVCLIYRQPTAESVPGTFSVVYVDASEFMKRVSPDEPRVTEQDP